MSLSTSGPSGADQNASTQGKKTPRFQKRTKTHSGCWTCRARRIRCDEAKPQCLRCQRRRMKCEGYGVRLHWIGASSQHEKDETQLEHGDFANSIPRSNVKPDQNRIVLSPRRIAEILAALDSVLSESELAKQGDNDPSCFVDCFGVFTLSKPPNNTSTFEPVGDLSLSPMGISSDVSNTFTEIGSSASYSLDNGTYDNDVWGTSGVANDCNLVDATITNGMVGTGQTPTLYDDSFLHDRGMSNEHENQNDGQQSLHDIVYSLQDHGCEAGNLSIYRCPSSPLSSTDSLLLNHYSQQVLYLFCVIDHEKSPWKTIHMPKAFQAAGEYSIKGSTTGIRGALLNTVLAISALLLSNNSQCRLLRPNEYTLWRSAAVKYRLQAIQDLRLSVESASNGGSRLKYKEHLATALSMITINVISGDLATCGIHLDGCFRLIRQVQRWKCKYSTKAQSLHRVYFYLRTIYESTASSEGRAGICVGSSSVQHHESSPDSITTPAMITGSDTDIYCRDILQAQMAGYGDGIDMDLSPGVSNCERIYGIPHGLLILLTQVIDLTDEIDTAEGLEKSDKLMDKCDGLEQIIMDWPTRVGLGAYATATMSVSAEIVHRHTLAFYNALIIYFAQNIRRVGHRFLQQYVAVVLESMEKIENLKKGTQVLAAPLYWPAFIAASEAHDCPTQERFRRWYDAMEIYRIESIRTGMKVLEEVWKVGPSSRPQRKSLWRQVVEKTEVQLMLS